MAQKSFIVVDKIADVPIPERSQNLLNLSSHSIAQKESHVTGE
jgi:hypothetical protein